MAWIDGWGWLCAVVGALISIPQVLRLLKLRTSAGLSLVMWQLNTAAISTWTVHGLRTAAPNIAWSNAVSAVLNVLVLRMIQRDRGTSSVALWTPVLVVLGIAVAVESLAPATLFGALITVPFAVGLLTQTRDLLHDPDLTGVSPLYLGLTLLIQVLWLSWGLVVHETAITTCALVLGVLALANLACFAGRRSGLVEARP